MGKGALLNDSEKAQMRSQFLTSFAAVLSGFVFVTPVFAHPHVFVEANIDVVRDADGNFIELRQVWRFDELFSATITLDFDDDGDRKLNEAELKVITDTVKESIADYDFYTALRVQGKPLEFYEPEQLDAYFEGDQMIMLMAVQPAEKYDFSKGPLSISVSDTSFYVAFDYEVKNVVVEGGQQACGVEVNYPDYDSLYADNSLSLTEAFFDDPSNTEAFGDEFYSWAIIDCK